MKIKKLGHCCLVIEVNGKRIMTDPGSYSTLQNQQKNIDIILITHEHQDHLHVDSLKTVLANNPNAQILTNTAVGNILIKEGIKYSTLEDGQSITLQNILFEGFGKEHAEIYQTFGQVQNTGYFIENKFFYPGDSFYNPGKQIGILALPIAGPWMRIKDAIRYALETKPKICFPVHDGMIQKDKPGPLYALPKNIFPEHNIEFRVLEEGTEEEF